MKIIKKYGEIRENKGVTYLKLKNRILENPQGIFSKSKLEIMEKELDEYVRISYTPPFWCVSKIRLIIKKSKRTKKKTKKELVTIVYFEYKDVFSL